MFVYTGKKGVNRKWEDCAVIFREGGGVGEFYLEKGVYM